MVHVSPGEPTPADRGTPPQSPPHERRPRVPTLRGERGWHVSPASDGRGRPPDDKGGSRQGMLGRRFITFVLILLVLNWVSVALFGPAGTTMITVPYSPTFLNQITAGNVSSISSQGPKIQGTFRQAVRYPPTATGTSSTHFATNVPDFADKVALSRLLQSKGVIVNASPPSSGPGVLVTVLLSFGPTLLFIGLLVLLFRRAGGGGMGALGAFGRSGARRVDPASQRVTFDDVAGIEEAKAELAEIVDFLRNPDRYMRLGGRIPRGVLLAGAPGTGKTLLARAVAGQANVPFFSISASEFVEAIVGVGASRVRDLFKQAKEAAPSIIFIDELDAIGRSRGSALVTGANDEREQTQNQILTEMDGFESDSAVIVLAATNRPEVLDSALLRPGRFDRRVTVPSPDKEGRRKILEVHTRSLPLGPDVDLEKVAASTPGMVGADLANLANEAALMAARRDHQRVQMDDFTDALEKILLGAPRNIVLSPEDRRRTAYHEAGHAIIGMLSPAADPVRKVSIIPRGTALGVTLSSPDADPVSYDEDHLRAQIKVALGGRGAEEVVLGHITTGAESDIQQLTNIARMMVGRWGMSDAIGPVAVLPRDGQGPLLPGAAEASETTQRLVDEEVRRIVEDSHEEVRQLLEAHRQQLDALAQALLEHETLDQEDAYAAAGLPAPPKAPEKPIAVAAMKGAPAPAPAAPAR